MSFQERADKQPRIKISEILKELSSLRQIQEPQQKIIAYNTIVSRIEALAQQTKDLRALLACQGSLVEQLI